MEHTLPSVPTPQPEHISFGHLTTIAGTIVLLLFFTFIKNPHVFSFHANSPAVSAGDPSVPHYYAYVPPADLQTPMVAGASTEPVGPSIINEDGTFSPAGDNQSGQILGVSTDQINLSLEGIQVAKQVGDSSDAIKKYLSDTAAIEANYVNSSDFEAALSSQDQTKIDAQVEIMKKILSELQKISVPHAAVVLQKNKILQYDSAITVLQNFVHADDNPEVVSQALGVFLQSQDDINSEMAKLNSQFNVISNVSE